MCARIAAVKVIFSGSFVRREQSQSPLLHHRARPSCFSTRMNLSLSTAVAENLLMSLTVKSLVIFSVEDLHMYV